MCLCIPVLLCVCVCVCVCACVCVCVCVFVFLCVMRACVCLGGEREGRGRGGEGWGVGWEISSVYVCGIMCADLPCVVVKVDICLCGYIFVCMRTHMRVYRRACVCHVLCVSMGHWECSILQTVDISYE